MKLRYITVSTVADKENSKINTKDILEDIDAGYEILSAVGDGAGSVHYILTRPEDSRSSSELARDIIESNTP